MSAATYSGSGLLHMNGLHARDAEGKAVLPSILLQQRGWEIRHQMGTLVPRLLCQTFCPEKSTLTM